jgi:hypothetical protein
VASSTTPASSDDGAPASAEHAPKPSPPRATRTGSPSGSNWHVPWPAQSALLKQTARRGAGQLAAHADVAVTPMSRGLPASIPMTDELRPSGMLAQQTSPASQSLARAHSKCKGLAQTIRLTHVPTSPERQQVSPSRQPDPPNGRQTGAACADRPASLLASGERWASDDEPHPARLSPNEIPRAGLKASSRAVPTPRRVPDSKMKGALAACPGQTSSDLHGRLHGGLRAPGAQADHARSDHHASGVVTPWRDCRASSGARPAPGRTGPAAKTRRQAVA